jgi:O-antigen/teichoic acid export membrane protein
MLRYSLPVFAATAMIMMLGNLDLVLVRHYIPGEQAGLYATAAVLGRIAFFLPAMLVAVLFPTVARARESGDESRKPFLVSLALTAVLGLSFALLCILWPQWIIGLLFGAKYAAAAPLLQIVSLAMALLAIVQVVVTYGLARADYLSLPPLALGVVLMFALALLYHQSALVIAWIVLGAVVFILAGSLGAWLYRDRPWKAA